MTGHTPGPWSLVPMAGASTGDFLIQSNDGRLATVIDMHGYMTPPFHAANEATNPTKANAALVAAAPDLLVALETILPDYKAWVGDLYGTEPDLPNFKAIARAEAAIAKARADQVSVVN